MNSKEGRFFIFLLVVIVAVGAGCVWYTKYKDKPRKPIEHKEEEKQKDPSEYDEKDFTIKLIKTVNSSQDSNYLISPYSIELALNLVREGADGNTKVELDSVLPNREIPIFEVENRISVANAAFIRNQYSMYIQDNYKDILEKNYNADMIYDPFVVPDKINDWVKEKTYGMIPSVVDNIKDDFILGIANAVAIDVEWQRSFDCIATRSTEFTKSDGSKMNVEMMHSEGNGKYLKNDDYTGVIIPYDSYSDKGVEVSTGGTQLEFVGILPNGTVDEFIEDLDEEKLAKIDDSISKDKAILRLGLPRFKYDYELSNFQAVLRAMGIHDAFEPYKADFTKIMARDDMALAGIENVYISEAIHKTYIDLNEKGTKAAAVTYFSYAGATSIDDNKYINLEFNKPFIYMIRDSETKEILFFGVIEEPNEWKGSTCDGRE